MSYRRTGSRSRRATLAAVVAIGLVVASCGGSDGDSESSEPGGDSTPTGDSAPSVDTASVDSSPQSTEAGSTDTAAPDTAAPDAVATDRDGTLRLAQAFPPSQWDPHMGSSAVVTQAILGPVYDNLLTLDENLEIAPMLATSWEVADDAMALTLTLRDDVTFQDGTPFDAAAVVANFDYMKNLEGALSTTIIGVVDEVEVVNDYEVRLVFNEPSPDFALRLTNILVGGMVSPTALASPEALATTPAGSGPYNLVSQGQDRAVYQRVAGYWDATIDANAPENLELLFIPDDNARLAALQSGQIDGASGSLALADPDGFAADNELDIYSFEGSGPLMGVRLNSESGPLADVGVRQAVSLAIDRAALAELVLFDRCEPTLQPFGPVSPGFNPDVVVDSSSYDPELAAQLVEEAGATGSTLSAVTLELPLFQSLATAVQAQLKEIGLELDITILGAADGQAAFRSGDIDMYFSSMAGSGDPSEIINTHFLGPNNPGGGPAEAVALNDTAQSFPLDSAERGAGYQELAAYMATDPVHAIICQARLDYLTQPNVVGLDEMAYSQVQSAWDVRHLAIAES